MFRLRLAWPSCAVALAVVAACGGGVGEVVALLGYTGAAGGAWVRDADSTTPKADLSDCSVGTCQLVISVPSSDPFASDYAITADGDVGTGTVCNASAGTVAGRSVKLPCFSGQFRSVDEMVSDDGKTRMLLNNFQPNFLTGSWVDIQHTDYRLKFGADDGASIATGCEIDRTQTGSVVLTYVRSNVLDGVFSSIQSVVITRGTQTETWTAEYVGSGALRLSRSGQVRELERRKSSDACA